MSKSSSYYDLCCKLERIILSDGPLSLSDLSHKFRKTKRQIEAAIRVSDRIHISAQGSYKIKRDGTWVFNSLVVATTTENPKPEDEEIVGVMPLQKLKGITNE